MSDIQAMFDLAAHPTDQPADGPDTSAPTNTTTNTNTTDTATTTPGSTEGQTTGAKYPSILHTFATEDAIPADLRPNLMTPPEFSAHLTVRNLTQLNMGADGVVRDQNVYNRLTAVRSPLPVVVIEDPAKVLIPVQEATKVWDENPTRVRGAATVQVGRRSDEELIEAAAKVAYNLIGMLARLESLKTKIDKATDTRDKYRDRWLKDRGIDWAKVEAKVAELATADTKKTTTEPDATN